MGVAVELGVGEGVRVDDGVGEGNKSGVVFFISSGVIRG